MEKNRKLIEIPKASKESCINSFQKYILNNYNFEAIKKLSSSGQIDRIFLRGMAWKIFLDVLPFNESIEKWKENLTYLRASYKILSDKVRKQQDFFEEKDKKKGEYNYDIKTEFLRKKSIVVNPFRPEKETKKLINLDLSRTFQELALFHEDKIINILSQVLYLWSLENPDVGYQQGMNDIASIIFLALYPYYFKNNLSENNSTKNKEEELYLFFNDEKELESDIYICFNNAMKKGIKQFYDFEFKSKEKQEEYINNICLFPKEIENNKEIIEELNLPLIIRCSLLINEKLKILDKELYSHFNKIGLNCSICLQRWLKCIFNREFELNDVLIIWDAIFSSETIRDEYVLYKIDLIALAMILRIRNFLLLCDQSQCFMILLQYQQLENILELIIFSDKLDEAIKELLSGKKSLFIENIINYISNYESNFQNKNKESEKNCNINSSPTIKTYNEGVEKLRNIYNKYHSLMDENDKNEFNNIIQFFKNYK